MTSYYQVVEEGIDKPNAREAIFGFCAWLTTLENKVEFSAYSNASIAAHLAEEFCEANELSEIRDDHYPDNFKFPDTRQLYDPKQRKK